MYVDSSNLQGVILEKKIPRQIALIGTIYLLDKKIRFRGTECHRQFLVGNFVLSINSGFLPFSDPTKIKCCG